MKSVKSNIFYIFTIAALLASVFSGAVTVTPARALSDTPLPNMPTANGIILPIVPDGAGGVYIGGNFTQLTPAGGGPAVTRNRIARINADGSIHPWNPDANGGVNDLAVSGNTVYVGGNFTSIGGQARNYIAALDATINTNNAMAWNPDANGTVASLAVSGNTVYARGLFTTIGGQGRNRIAALDATINTNNATAWNPDANNTVFNLAVSGNTVYAGGSFTSIGGQGRNRIAALDATINTNNATAWNPDANNTVNALEVSGNTVYAGGLFTTIGGQGRNRIAALDATINTNNATTWNPNADALVRTLAVSGNTVYAGGLFTTIGGNARPSFAAFSLDATPPTVASQTLQASYTGTGPSSFTVTFSEDVNNSGSGTLTDDATNINNYIIMEQGSTSGFQTTACNAIDAVKDTRVTPSGVTYIPNTAIVNLGSALSTGTYRLFVCGTTSITDLAGNELNGGTDFTFDFTVGAATTITATTGNTTASSLPKTGFAPNKVTSLPVQPATLAYANIGDPWLEIPSLNVKSTIVGVPQNADKDWDVSWLGDDIGWLNGTAFPTWNGNSVLTAHVTNASGLDGPFAALKSLRYGDQIIVHFGGAKYVYEVRETKLARPYSVNYAFQSMQDHSYLTLVTCSGYNPLNESYLFRRVVRAVLVSAESE